MNTQQNNYHARQELMLSKETSAMIKNLKILVVGVGAGGNDLLKNLVLMGFGNITIVDFDYVEDSNLSKTTLFRIEDIGKSKAKVAAERLNEIALHPNPNIVGLHGNLIYDIGKGVFLDHDIVICCVDTLKARAYINDWCIRTNTPFFEMGFSKFDVNITFFAPEGDMVQKDGTVITRLPTSDGYFPTLNGEFPVCIRETIPNGFGNIDEKRNHCAGLRVRDVDMAKTPSIQAASAMAGALISTELIKYLSGQDTLRNRKLFYDGMNHEIFTMKYSKSSKCNIHNEAKLPIKTLVIDKDTTIKMIIEKLTEESNSPVTLFLPEVFYISGTCQSCGKQILYNRRESLIYNDERWCEECKAKYPDNYSIRLNYPLNFVQVDEEITSDSDGAILSLKLSDIGIPNNDLLKCRYLYGMNSVWLNIRIK